ncbi:hypothetical protein V6N13_073267 [Hibiscus sabdariffa]
MRHGAEHCFDPLTRAIHELLDQQWEVRVGFIRRSVNQVVDGLAKLARNRIVSFIGEFDFDLRLFLAPPDGLVSMVHDDLSLVEGVD